MTGVVASKDKCACGQPFPSSKNGVPIICSCGARPSKFILNIYWNKKSRLIYLDRKGDPLLSFPHAWRTLESIRAEIDQDRFDPEFYARKGAYRFEKILGQLEKNYEPGSGTHKALRTRSRHFQRFFPYQIEDIRPLDIREWWLDLQENGYSANYNNAILKLLRRIFALAIDLRILEHNPAMPIKMVKVKKTEIKWLTIEDQDAILAALPVHDRSIFLFMMICGCRVMEAAALQRQDIDWKAGKIYIRHTLSNGKLGPTKTRRERPLPLTEELRELFNGLPAHISGYVFISRRGRPYSYNTLIRRWYRACDDAGYPRIQMKNASRHSLGMRLVKEAPDSKGGIWLAAQILGHSSINMTRHYAEMLTDDMAPALTRKKKFNSISIPPAKSTKRKH